MRMVFVDMRLLVLYAMLALPGKMESTDVENRSCEQSIIEQNRTCILKFEQSIANTWREKAVCKLPPGKVTILNLSIKKICSRGKNDQRITVMYKKTEILNCSEGGMTTPYHFPPSNMSRDFIVEARGPNTTEVEIQAIQRNTTINCSFSSSKVLKEASSVTMTVAIIGGVLVAAMVGLALLCFCRSKRSSSSKPPAIPPPSPDLQPGEATHHARQEDGDDEGEYDHVGRPRTAGGACAVDPTYGHLESDGDIYSQVRRGPAKGPSVIKGDNLYGHLATSDDGNYDQVRLDRV